MAARLLINPRAGNARPSTEELETEARRRGIDVYVVRDGDDLEEVARAETADALGMAGGDGSLAAVAAVAMERGVPFACVPYGTRNHFARDLGLDRSDPIDALDAFAGAERRVDVGRVGERVFLNNVSLGLYARLVHRREHHRRRRALFARARAVLLAARHHHQTRFRLDGASVAARVVVIANNAYALEVLSLGERERLDQGLLHVYVPEGLVPSTWHERAATRLTVDVPEHRVRAAVDGEPAELETPLEFRIEPGALRVLVPGSPGG